MLQMTGRMQNDRTRHKQTSFMTKNSCVLARSKHDSTKITHYPSPSCTTTMGVQDTPTQSSINRVTPLLIKGETHTPQSSKVDHCGMFHLSRIARPLPCSTSARHPSPEEVQQKAPHSCWQKSQEGHPCTSGRQGIWT
jgi:hypothetical protein